MERTFKAAAIQTNSVLYDKTKNLSIAEALVEQAGAVGCKVIVLPELFNTGYFVKDKDHELAETIPGPTTEWMQKYCVKYDCFIIAAIIERAPLTGVLYDTAVLVGKEGIVGTYRKVYLWQTESLRFAHGSEYPVFDLDFAKVGMQICYEAGFPEGARLLTLKGANIIVYSSAFSGRRSYAWELATRARALENGVYVIASNRCGQEGEEAPFAAHSRIIAPNGAVLKEGQDGACAVIHEIDLPEVEKQRVEIPYLRDYNIPLISRHYLEL